MSELEPAARTGRCSSASQGSWPARRCERTHLSTSCHPRSLQHPRSRGLKCECAPEPSRRPRKAHAAGRPTPDFLSPSAGGGIWAPPFLTSSQAMSDAGAAGPGTALCEPLPPSWRCKAWPQQSRWPTAAPDTRALTNHVALSCTSHSPPPRTPHETTLLLQHRNRKPTN